MITIKKLDINNVDIFTEFRMEFYKDMNKLKEGCDYSEFKKNIRNYYTSHIGKELFCFAAFLGDEIIASTGIRVFKHLPNPDNITGKEAYVVNVYTRLPHRRKGYANRLMHELLDFAKENEINRLWLYSTEKGKKLYLKNEFEHIPNAMEIIFNK